MSKLMKIGAILLCLIVAVGLFAACDDKGGDGEKQSQGAGQQDSTSQTNETIDVSLLPPSSVGLSFQLNNDKKSYTVTGIGNCTDKDIVISSYQNLPVTSIGKEAFIYCDTLTGVTLGSSVTNIGESAFARSGLTNVTLPDSVTSIGNQAFLNCNKLTSVTIGNGVTTIGEEAFKYCHALTDVTLGNGIKTIGNFAFNECAIVNVTIPDSVTTIGESAFYYCSNLTSIVIPDSVTSIGEEAFYSCGNLMKVTLGKNLTTVGGWAFGCCDGLYEIVNHSSLELSIGSGKNGNVALNAYVVMDSSGNKTYRSGYDEATYIATDDGFRFVCEYTIFGEARYKLIGYIGEPRTVTLPTNVNGNSYSLHKVRGLTSVIVPEGTTSIDFEAFDCISLKSVTIPKSVTSIGSDAFHQYVQGGLTAVYYVGTADEWAQIEIMDGNYGLTAATCYFYSETQPTAVEGNYWHYVDGEPTPW